jgi:V-type H+-transporting ATPase subunit E
VRLVEDFGFCELGKLGQGKMNDSDVSKQVQQMVHFIKQEAEEKANEISVAAEEVNPEFFFLIRSGKMERKQKMKKKNKTMQMLLGVVE